MESIHLTFFLWLAASAFAISLAGAGHIPFLKAHHKTVFWSGLILTLIFLTIGIASVSRGPDTTETNTTPPSVTPSPNPNVRGHTSSGACRSSDGYSGGQCKGDVVVDRNITLTSDIETVGNISINSGVVLTTDGHSVIAGGSFDNNGTIDTGRPSNGGRGVGGATRGNNGSAYASSYGGGGGGGGAGGMGGNNDPAPGGAGGATSVFTGGPGGSVGSGDGGSGGNGATPNLPSSLSSSLINTWYQDDMRNHLTGAGGGAGGGGGGWAPPVPRSGSGGDGAYGLYIQARTIAAGNISADGGNGSRGGGGCGSGANGGGAGGGGGGGGGSLLFAYSDSGKYVSGAYSLNGGSGAAGGQAHCAIPNFNGGSGGNGGNGHVFTFEYARQPVTPP